MVLLIFSFIRSPLLSCGEAVSLCICKSLFLSAFLALHHSPFTFSYCTPSSLSSAALSLTFFSALLLLTNAISVIALSINTPTTLLSCPWNPTCRDNESQVLRSKHKCFRDSYIAKRIDRLVYVLPTGHSKAVCLTCSARAAIIKSSDVKRHYEP